MAHCEVCKSDDQTICHDLRVVGFSPSPYDPESCCCSCHDIGDDEDEYDCYECSDKRVV